MVPNDNGDVNGFLAFFHGGIATVAIAIGAVLSAAYGFFRTWHQDKTDRREFKLESAEKRDARLFAQIASERDRVDEELRRERKSGQRWYLKARALYGDLCDRRELVKTTRAFAQDWVRDGKPYPIVWPNDNPPVPEFNDEEF